MASLVALLWGTSRHLPDLVLVSSVDIILSPSFVTDSFFNVSNSPRLIPQFSIKRHVASFTGSNAAGDEGPLPAKHQVHSKLQVFVSIKSIDVNLILL
jgi:hypothetical protein